MYYLISFDEQTLLDVLQRTDLVGSNDQRAQEFLEKLIQVRLDLPAFRDRDIAAMTTRLLNALLDSHGVSMTADQEQRFSEAYFRHLQDRLRTPRAIKRYFGQAGATLGSLAGRSTSSTSWSSPFCGPVSQASTGCWDATAPN